MSSVEPEQYANQRDGSKESVGELVVAGGDGAILLELAEEPLDQIALAIEREIGVARLGAIGLGRNDGRDGAALEGLDQSVGVVGFVGQERVGLDLVEQRLGLGDIGRLPGRQRKSSWISDRIDDGVNLGCQPAAGAPDGLVLAVFFLAPALC